MTESISGADKTALYNDLVEEGSIVPMEPKFVVPHHDAVSHPSHYTTGDIECIDALRAMTCKMVGFVAFCAANAVKYIWRHPWKDNPVQDLKKARWYLDKLIAYYESKGVK